MSRLELVGMQARPGDRPMSKHAVAPPIEGHVAPGFRRVRDAFRENFLSREEVGAAVCVYRDGEPVVDLWGGYRDPDRVRPWERDTLVCMMSVAKGVTAVAVMMQVDRGIIDLEQRVAHYWPGFAHNGKGEITVRQMLGGFAALIYLDHAPPGAMLDWDQMIAAIEAQAPAWPPGTRGAYHSATAGFLFGELIRRTDGRAVDAFVREEIARPLGIEFVLGVHAGELDRLADIIANDASVTGNALRDPTTKLGRAWRVQPQVDGLLFNDPRFRAAVIPSASGHSNARSVARLWAALANGGTLDGVRLMDPATVELARSVQWDAVCEMTDRPFRYGLGMFLNAAPMTGFGPNPRSFGHPGAGGAVGFADPENRLAFAYSPNRMCAGAGLGDRCEALIAALYEQDSP
jgi:CubicO group peptidase (beta-lactamase class C family)